MVDEKRYKAVVIGSSAGGLNACMRLFSGLPKDFPLPIIAVQHLPRDESSVLPELLNANTLLTVKEAEGKELISAGFIYTAPSNYHLLVESDNTFSLSIDNKVNFSRPSIDVLFESAAYVWTSGLIGIILTGANNDGSKGIEIIKKSGGLTIAQDPKTAEFPTMPQAAIETSYINKVLSIDEIIDFLKGITTNVMSI